MANTQSRTRRAYCLTERWGEPSNLLGNRNAQPSMAGDVTHSRTHFRVFSNTSNCTGLPVLLWMTATRSRMVPPMTRPPTLRRTKSQPRSLLSIARLKGARSLRFSAISSRAQIAQTCLGRSGCFWLISRLFFHGEREGLVAGSWILGKVRTPSIPPTPGIGNVPAREA